MTTGDIISKAQLSGHTELWVPSQDHAKYECPRSLVSTAILMFFSAFSFQFGTRFIIEAMQAAGHSLSTLFLCGGLSKNPLFVQMHADITGKPPGVGVGTTASLSCQQMGVAA